VTSTVCAQHPDLAAREACGRCGRPLCLDCAIPVRGEVRCARCVREELGDAVPGTDPSPRSAPRVDPAAAALFLAAVLVSILPWGSDRAGILSAWSPSPDPWPLVSIALLAAAGMLALRRRQRRRAAHVVAGGLAVLVGLIALPAPPFATRTVVPFLVVGLGAVGTGLAASRFLGRPREERGRRP